MAFFNKEREIWCIVHGDDFTFTGYDEDLTWIEKIMKDAYEIKVRGRLGDEKGDKKEIDISGRVIRDEDWGVLMESGSSTLKEHS